MVRTLGPIALTHDALVTEVNPADTLSRLSIAAQSRV